MDQTCFRTSHFVDAPATSPKWSQACCIACCALALGACGGHSAPAVDAARQASLVGIGFIPGGTASQALAVSADGNVVVGSTQAASGELHAVRWSADGGLLELGRMPGGTFSSARAVSADGAVVVGEGDALSATRAVFRWSAATGLVQLASLANAALCVPGGVSGDGNVVVGTCLTTNNAAFRWTDASGMVSLGQFGGGSDRTSSALAISTDASVIAGAGHPVLNGAMLWSSNGTVSMLGRLAGMFPRRPRQPHATAVSWWATRWDKPVMLMPSFGRNYWA